MKKKINSEFLKVVGLGCFPPNFTLNLKLEEMHSLPINLNELKYLNDTEILFRQDNYSQRVVLDTNVFLPSLLVFINKTSRFKFITEHLIINSTTIEQFYNYLSISNLYEENNLKLKYTNLYSDNVSLRICVDGKEVNYLEEESKKNILEEREEEESIKSIKEMANDDYLSSFTNIRNPFDNEKEKSSDLLLKIQFNFQFADYIFLDLNNFIHNIFINLSDLFLFLQNLLQRNNKLSLVLFFPKTNNLQLTQTTILVNLLSLAEYVIFDRKDAYKFSLILDCDCQIDKIMDKVISLNSQVSRKFKFKTISFLIIDTFNKFEIISKDTSKNMIEFSKLYDFNFGFKKDYLSEISSRFTHLKSIFFGGFFSSIMTKSSFDEAFRLGKISLEKMIKQVENNIPFPKIFNYLHPDENHLVNLQKSNNTQKDFIIDATDKRKSELKFYDPLKDKNLRIYFSNPKIIKNMENSGIIKSPVHINQLKKNQYQQKDTLEKVEPMANHKIKNKSLVNKSDKYMNIHPIKNLTLPKIIDEDNSLNTINIGKINNKFTFAKFDRVDSFSQKSMPEVTKSNFVKKSNSLLVKSQNNDKSTIIKKNTIRYEDTSPMEAEYVYKKLNQKIQGDKPDNYIKTISNEISTEKEKKVNTSYSKKESKKLVSKNSLSNQKYKGVTIIIQDI